MSIFNFDVKAIKEAKKIQKELIKESLTKNERIIFCLIEIIIVCILIGMIIAIFKQF